ncbi:MAG: hypothetical protein ACYDC6_11160 [Acidobacteriaceae bacterium]
MFERDGANHEEQNFPDDFERELQAALRPRAAPAGFTDRVMKMQQVVRREPSDAGISNRRASLQFSNPQMWLRKSAAAGLLLVVGLGGYLQHERLHRIEGERARQQVLLALRITGATLQNVRQKINETRP